MCMCGLPYTQKVVFILVVIFLLLLFAFGLLPLCFFVFLARPSLLFFFYYMSARFWVVCVRVPLPKEDDTFPMLSLSRHFLSSGFLLLLHLFLVGTRTIMVVGINNKS